MSGQSDELQRLHEELRSGQFRGNQYSLLHRFGNEAFLEARPTVEAFLENASPELRYIALNVLVLHWGLMDHRPTSLRMATEDPDEDVRRLAAACVGSLFRGSRSPDALRVLLGIIAEKHENAFIHDSAYSAILEILGVPVEKLPSADKLNWPADIDWSKLREAQAIVDDSYRS